MEKIDALEMSRDMVENLLEGAKRLYPREEITLLRGKKKKKEIIISDLLIPPIASRGRGFSGFSTHMLPMDLSIVGIAHSHPSGSLQPSPHDLNHFFGRIMIIVAYPFTDDKCIAVYDSEGDTLILRVTEDRRTSHF